MVASSNQDYQLKVQSATKNSNRSHRILPDLSHVVWYLWMRLLHRLGRRAWQDFGLYLSPSTDAERKAVEDVEGRKLSIWCKNIDRHMILMHIDA